MPDTESEKPDFDELGTLDELEPLKTDDDSSELQPAETTEAEEGEAEKETEDQKAGDQEAKEQETEDQEAEDQPKEDSKQTLYIEVAAIAIVCVGILAGTLYGAASEGLFYCSMLSMYLLAISAIPYVLWKARETNTLYRVLLAIALAAILTAIMCMLSELKRYDYDVKAKGAQSVSVIKPHED